MLEWQQCYGSVRQSRTVSAGSRPTEAIRACYTVRNCVKHGQCYITQVSTLCNVFRTKHRAYSSVRSVNGRETATLW